MIPVFWRLVAVTEMVFLAGTVVLITGVRARVTWASVVAAFVFLVLASAVNWIGWSLIFRSRWGDLIAGSKG